MEIRDYKGDVAMRIAGDKIYDADGRWVYVKNGNYICNASGHWVYEIRDDKIYNTQGHWVYQIHKASSPMSSRPPEINQISTPSAKAVVGANMAARHKPRVVYTPKTNRLPLIIVSAGVIVLIVGLAIFFSGGNDGSLGYATGGNDSNIVGNDNATQNGGNQQEIATGNDAANPPAQEPTPESDETVEEPADIEPEEDDNLFGGFAGFDQFMAIALGTHVDDAISALGNPTSTMTMDILGTESTTKTWWTINFFRLSSSETVTFTNGYATSVMSTADASSNISAYEFSQVSTGMSEIEVFNILGAPYSVTIVEFMGSTSVTVMWINANFSSGTVTFTNGVVSSTMNMNLD